MNSRAWTARFGPDDNTGATVNGVQPDVAEALLAGLRGERMVEAPAHAADHFHQLTTVIAQTTRLIQHLEAFRELAIRDADRTSPYADRQAIAMAGAMPPSRLYRILERQGQPRDRKST